MPKSPNTKDKFVVVLQSDEKAPDDGCTETAPVFFDIANKVAVVFDTTTYEDPSSALSGQDSWNIAVATTTTMPRPPNMRTYVVQSPTRVTIIGRFQMVAYIFHLLTKLKNEDSVSKYHMVQMASAQIKDTPASIAWMARDIQEFIAIKGGIADLQKFITSTTTGPTATWWTEQSNDATTNQNPAEQVPQSAKKLYMYKQQQLSQLANDMLFQTKWSYKPDLEKFILQAKSSTCTLDNNLMATAKSTIARAK